MTQQDFDPRLEELKQFDTPSITNVVATYPDKEDLCLGLYNPWTTNWYTDSSLKCMYPELGRRAGYAVTCVYEAPDPSFKRLGFVDVLKAIEASPKPVILVVKQNMPEALKNKNGLIGGNMVTAMKTMGCVGCISDGPSRDVDEIREMDFQYMLTGACAGHGAFSVAAVNVPVQVCGMDVAPGEIIHMDENGAVKFPADKLDQVTALSYQLAKVEKKRMAAIRACKTAEEIGRVMGGFESIEK